MKMLEATICQAGITMRFHVWRGLMSVCAAMGTAGVINHFSWKGIQFPGQNTLLIPVEGFPSRMVLVAVEDDVQLDGFLSTFVESCDTEWQLGVPGSCCFSVVAVAVIIS